MKSLLHGAACSMLERHEQSEENVTQVALYTSKYILLTHSFPSFSFHKKEVLNFSMVML